MGAYDSFILCIWAEELVWKANWNLVLSCLIQLVWKKRNSRAFQNIERSLD